MTVLESHKGYYLWHYLPSIPAAAIFVTLFTLSFLALFYRLIRTRTWFCIPFLVGVIFEITGYIGRAISHSKTGELGPYIMQATLLLVAPALFAASIYMVLGRLISSVDGARYSLVPVRWMTKIFVAGDVFAFMVQAGGAGIMAGGKKSSFRTGSNIVLAGLVIQILMFGFFVVVAAVWQKRFGRSAVAGEEHWVPWRSIMVMLYSVSASILVRSIFRVVEYAQGNDGYLLSVEWTIYIFDALLMWAVTVLWFWRYPSGIGKNADAGRESRLEMQRARK